VALSAGSESSPAAAGGRRRLLFWRSPADQPGWARPALLIIAAAAAWSYSWRAASAVNIEIYYAAAVRSMSMNFRNFVFGAFDPDGTVTTDKLPGAFWLQAISVRLFGVHNWALVLPQVIEGTVTVLVLYHAVRRMAGPAAGVLAAGILAISPATVALNRGNISDTLMILLAVIAADATVTAVLTGRRRPIVMAGVAVGLAFQAKMIEAWLVLPAVAACYLLAAPGGWPQRIRRTCAMAVVALAVSLSWMTAVTLWPASMRPYFDGSYDNSVFQQVFVYNGFGRLDQASPDQLVDKSINLGLPAPPPPAWDRLLTGSLGRDTGWLLGAAVITVICGIAARRREPRSDPIRACLVLWAAWLAVLAVTFSVSTAINSYYTAALSPAVAAVLGSGLALGWRLRRSRRTALVLGAIVAGTAAYAWWLLPSSGTGLPSWLKSATAVLAAVAICCLAAAWLRWPMLRAASIVITGLAVLAVPLAASVSLVSGGLGPFETPFQSHQATADATAFFGAGFQAAEILPGLEAADRGTPFLMATQTAVLAAPFIYASGREVLPIGGFTGTIPEPTLSDLKFLIQVSDVHLFVQAPHTSDRRLTWVARNCIKVTKRTGPPAILPVSVYYCGAFIFLPNGF
jgi:4-amino-4-deoxy-L-arabinose transferase-like glycosyltransferase